MTQRERVLECDQCGRAVPPFARFCAGCGVEVAEQPADIVNRLSEPAATWKAEPRPWWRSPFRVAGAILVALFAIGFVSSLLKDDTPSEADVADALGASNSDISVNDQALLTDFGRYPRAWNEASTPLVRDYIDVDVPPDVWVRNARGQLRDMRTAVDALREVGGSLDDVGLRGLVTQMTHNYEAKLASWTALVNAVDQGDLAGEQRAAAALDEAATEGQRLGSELLARIERLVGKDVVRERLNDILEQQRRDLGLG